MEKILIFGGGGGLGRALAGVYGQAGFEVTVKTRNDCDLSDPDAVRRLASDATFLDGGYGVCVFAAATSEAGFADALDGGAVRRCMEVNFYAPITLFEALTSATPGCRRFVFVLSGAADLLVPGLSPYSLSKRALRDYLYVATLEKSFADCHILIVSPGGMDTGFDTKTRIHGAYTLPQGTRPRPAEWVAARIFRAERANRRRLDLAPIPRVLGWIQSLAPRLVMPFIRLFSRLQR